MIAGNEESYISGTVAKKCATLYDTLAGIEPAALRFRALNN